jgi:hypothetical protein
MKAQMDLRFLRQHALNCWHITRHQFEKTPSEAEAAGSHGPSPGIGPLKRPSLQPFRGRAAALNENKNNGVVRAGKHTLFSPFTGIDRSEDKRGQFAVNVEHDEPAICGDVLLGIGIESGRQFALFLCTQKIQ